MSYGRVEDEKDILIFKDSSMDAQALEATESTSTNQEEAYNPETGEINWDCPCIAGMVKPPCGDKFKEAFSCFVYSKAEPKGSECINEFREMKDVVLLC